VALPEPRLALRAERIDEAHGDLVWWISSVAGSNPDLHLDPWSIREAEYERE
jgi:hypothetical protein